MYWGVTMVQLIALLYKDQHVGTLQKLLNLWLEASLSDSSDDNESNTSPTNQSSCNSSPVVTSDSSDTCCGPNKGTSVTNFDREIHIIPSEAFIIKLTDGSDAKCKSIDNQHVSTAYKVMNHNHS